MRGAATLSEHAVARRVVALLVLPVVVPLAGKAMPAVGRRASRAFGALCARVGVVFFAFVGGSFLQTGQRVAAGRVAPALIVADDAAWGDRVFVGACTALLGAAMPGVGGAHAAAGDARAP